MLTKHLATTMYQMSQSYCPIQPRSSSYSSSSTYTSRGSSGLEYITQSASSHSSSSTHLEPSITYANISSSPSFHTYNTLHIPSFSSFSSSASPITSNYSYSSKLPTYSHNQTQYQQMQTHQEYHFQPDNFLKPGKQSIFVGDAQQIRPFIEDAFQHMFNQPFPTDIKITICNESEFRKIAPSPGTIGLSINRRQQGLLSEIFVLNDSLARVLLTFGHELGHVLTKTLPNPHDEEAKAYSFSIAWLNLIKEHNIANLQDTIITETPAHNGLHNVAFNFISKLLKQGQDAWNIYTQIISQITSIENIPELLLTS